MAHVRRFTLPLIMIALAVLAAASVTLAVSHGSLKMAGIIFNGLDSARAGIVATGVDHSVAGIHGDTAKDPAFDRAVAYSSAQGDERH